MVVSTAHDILKRVGSITRNVVFPATCFRMGISTDGGGSGQGE